MTTLRDVVLAAILAGVLLPVGVSAQARGASVWLPSDHWSVRAASRLHAAGLIDVYDPTARQRTSLAVAALLRAAIEGRGAAEDGSAGVRSRARLANAYGRRFAQERPGAWAASGGAGERWIEGELAAGLVLRRDALLAGGYTLEREWTGPRVLPDVTSAGGGALAGLALSTHVAVTAAAVHDGAAARASHITIDAALGPVGAWLGRRAPGFAPGAGGGLVLDGAMAFEGVGVHTQRPLRLPLLGAVSGELFGGVVDRNGFVETPWFGGARLHASPHDRFDVGITRAAVFGGLGGADVGVRQLLEVLVGANLSGDYADDQVLTFDARWRPPSAVPVQLHAEWGMHDIDPGVLIDMPSFAVGVRLPVLPFAPALGAALEHVRIAASCCGNPPWYQHFELADGWTEGGVPLGHPLGGHGNEWRLRLEGSPLLARVVFDVSAFRRRRSAENLYAPDRTGSSVGFDATVDAQLNGRYSASVVVRAEDGRGWREARLFIFARGSW